MRADIYDSSLSAIYFLNIEQLESATKVADTMVLVTDNEFQSDGRVRVSYAPTFPIARQYFPSQPITFASLATVANISSGDQAFQILALTRMYVHSGEYKVCFCNEWSSPINGNSISKLPSRLVHSCKSS